jgi:rhodanese-related sulfurtransferase
LPLTAETQESDTTLLDLRSQVAFASGFIPGSFHFPDTDCLELLRTNGLLKGRRIYAVADEPEQIARCGEILASGMELEFGNWSSPKTINWRRRRGALGSSPGLRLETIVIDTRRLAAFAVARIPESICLPLENLTRALAGLPVETVLCVVFETGNRARFAAALIGNLGFRNVSLLRGGFAAYREHRLPLAQSSH